MDWLPALRPEVVRVPEREDDPASATVALYDPIFDRRVNLGAISRALVSRLKGDRPLPEILDEVAAELPERGRAAVEQTMRTLLLMNLVPGAGDDIYERGQAVRRGEVTLPIVTLPGARFTCQGSGACCHNYALGPLLQADLARLHGLAIEGAYPDLGPGPYTEERTLSDSVSGSFLKTRDGRCVFQQDDGRCGIHAAFGAEAKPRMCRIFPWQEEPTIEGIKVFDRGECATFATSARAGLPLAQDLNQVQSLLFPQEQMAIHHPLVHLEGGVACDYGYFLSLQRGLCELAGAVGQGDAAGAEVPPRRSIDAVLAMGRLVRAFVTKVAACPVGPGEPGRTVAALLASKEAYLQQAAPAPADLLQVAGLAGDLLSAVLPSIVHGERTPDQILSIRDLEHFAAIIHTIQALAIARSGGGEGAGGLDPFLSRVMQVEAGGQDIEAAFGVSLQNQAFGIKMLIEDRPVPAMLRVGLTYLVTLMGARRLSERDGAAAVRRADFSAAHSLAQRIFSRQSVQEVLVEQAGLTWVVLEALPLLTG